MHPDEALDIIRQLTDGMNPTTGEPLPIDDLCQHPQVLRALFVAQHTLQRLQEQPSGGNAAGRAAAPRPEKAGVSWAGDEDRRLSESHDAGASPKDLAKAHQRSVSAIRARLVKLGKLPPTESRYAVRPDEPA